MTDQVNATAAALQLDNAAALARFTRSIQSNCESVTTFHLYEHRNNSFSVHGPHHVRVANELARNEARPAVDLPCASDAKSNAHPDAVVPTLILNAREACALAGNALFAAGRKVVVWAVDANGRISSSMDGTPGCPASLASWLGERPDDGVVLAVRPVTRAGARTLGLAVWDPSSSTLRATDVLDNDALAALETVFVSTNAREVLVPDDVPQFDADKLAQLAEQSSIAVTVRKRGLFDGADVGDVVHRLAGARHVEDAILDGCVAAGALAALIGYVGLANDAAVEGHVALRELEVAGTMKLDGAVMRALNILPFPGDGGRTASLFGLLNRGKSRMGGRLLRRWLTQPLQSVDEINGRLDVVEAFVNAPEMRRVVLDEHVAKLPDINLLCRRLTKDGGAKAKLEDVVRMYQCSVRLSFLCDALEQDGKDSVIGKRFAQPLRKLSRELAHFDNLVEETVDLERIDIGEFAINPKVDPELKTLRREQDKLLAGIDEEKEHVSSKIKGLKTESLKLEQKDNLGYFFRLTRKEEKFIRGKSAYMVLETRKDGVRFQTRELRKLSDQYSGVASEYHAKEADFREKVFEVVMSYVEIFCDVAALIAEMDVLAAFGVVASESRAAYTRPTMTAEGSGLLLRDARHPIVEENLADGAEFISNTIDLRRASARGGTDGDGDSMMQEESPEGATADEVERRGGSVVLVTGPNMGGKSTFIRCAGVLTLMAHVGCFVPASEALVPVTDRIFARVGAGDNQHRALSTFMAEMVETAVILRSATWKSLVIIDELGRGTGTTDGFGLAHAIGRHLATGVRCGCLFATHFFELTALADEVGDVRNAHVSAVVQPEGKGLTFLYEVRDGACDQSFGVNVAEMAMFPESVVAVAKRKADELEGCAAFGRRIRVANIKEDEVEAGRKLLAEFEGNIAKLPRDSEDEIESSAKVARELMDALVAKRNGYVAALMNE